VFAYPLGFSKCNRDAEEMNKEESVTIEEKEVPKDDADASAADAPKTKITQNNETR
jgi:hypothetical protein